MHPHTHLNTQSDAHIYTETHTTTHIYTHTNKHCIFVQIANKRVRAQPNKSDLSNKRVRAQGPSYATPASGVGPAVPSGLLGANPALPAQPAQPLPAAQEENLPHVSHHRVLCHPTVCISALSLVSHLSPSFSPSGFSLCRKTPSPASFTSARWQRR